MKKIKFLILGTVIFIYSQSLLLAQSNNAKTALDTATTNIKGLFSSAKSVIRSGGNYSHCRRNKSIYKVATRRSQHFKNGCGMVRIGDLHPATVFKMLGSSCWCYS